MDETSPEPPAARAVAPADARPAAAAPAPASPAKPKKKESWWDLVRFLLYVFVFAVIIRSFVVAPFSIPSGSMLPRLMIGDYMFVAKWPFGYSRYSFPFGIANFDGRTSDALPERGDVVVFRDPAQNEDIVKRVIGLPGDTVQVIGGQVILNGRPLPRTRIADYLMPVSENSPCGGSGQLPPPPQAEGPSGGRVCVYPRYRETLPGGFSYDVLDQIGDAEADNTEIFRVPAGHLFMMGDNRDDSQDSRFSPARGGFGMVPVENVLGRVLVTFWSTDGSSEWLLPWTWFTAARWDRIGKTE
jgi:signal peptidase I